MEPDNTTRVPWLLAGRRNPGEYILLRVRNRLIAEWNDRHAGTMDQLVATRALDVVDHCLSQLRSARVNR